MKTELSKIAQDLEQGRITDQEARTLLLGLLGVRLSLPIRPDFSGEIYPEHVQVDLKDLKKCGWDYAKKWLEEVREEKYQWANAFYNLKRALEGNEA